MRHLTVSTSLVALAACGCLLAALAAFTGSGSEAAPSRLDGDQRRAAAVVADLDKSGLPVTAAVICRRPSPSSPEPPASAAFRDTTVRHSYPRPVVAAGGVVEVHASAGALRYRLAQLDRQTHRAQEYGFDEGGRVLHGERRVVAGTVLLRLSGFVSDGALRDYSRALRSAVANGAHHHHPDLPEAACSI